MLTARKLRSLDRRVAVERRKLRRIQTDRRRAQTAFDWTFVAAGLYTAIFIAWLTFR
jgi:hypothetical protein